MGASKKEFDCVLWDREYEFSCATIGSGVVIIFIVLVCVAWLFYDVYRVSQMAAKLTKSTIEENKDLGKMDWEKVSKVVRCTVNADLEDGNINFGNQRPGASKFRSAIASTVQQNRSKILQLSKLKMKGTQDSIQSMKNAESFESNTTGLTVPARRLSRKLSTASELNFASELTTRSPSRVNLVRKESSTEVQGASVGQGRSFSQRTSLVSNMAGAAKQLVESNNSVVDKLHNSSQDYPSSDIEKQRMDAEKNATNKGTLIRTEAVERFTPTDSRANTIDSDKATPPLPTLCNSINGVSSPRSIHELRGLLNSPLRRSRTNSSISPTSSLRPPKQSPSKNSLKSSESGSSTTSMTVREGEYEDGFIDILLEKFSDSFGFVVLTKPFESCKFAHYVGDIMAESAAARVDLRYRDKILSVNDVPVEDKSHDQIVQIVQQGRVLRLRIKRLMSWQTTIEKDDAGFGFGVRGGADFELPLYILRLHETTNEIKFRGIRVGDILLAVNSVNIASFTHQQTVDLIKKSFPTLHLRLRRGNGTVPALSRGLSR